MNVIVVTEPPVEPVTLAEALAHLRLDAFGSPPEHPDDAMILRHIATARAEVERITGRALVQQTLRMAAPEFPCGGDYVELRRPPYISLMSVEYYDSLNVLNTLASSNYYINDSSDVVARLEFIDGFNVSTYARSDAVRISWIAGYEPVGSPPDDYTVNIPPAIKDAILLGVQLLYVQFKPDDREAIERTRAALLAGFGVVSF